MVELMIWRNTLPIIAALLLAVLLHFLGEMISIKAGLILPLVFFAALLLGVIVWRIVHSKGY